MSEKQRIIVAVTAIVAAFSLLTVLASGAEAGTKCHTKALAKPEKPTYLSAAIKAKQESVAQIVDAGTFSATAYCKCRKCCGKWADVPGTYTGEEPVEGVTIAVDPKVIPLHSVVFVTMPNGEVRRYVAQDTGGAIKGNKIDVYFDTHDAALAWGRQEVQVRYAPQEVGA